MSWVPYCSLHVIFCHLDVPFQTVKRGVELFNVIFESPFSQSWREGTYDTPYKSPNFFVTTDLTRMGFFTELHTSFMILNYTKR